MVSKENKSLVSSGAHNRQVHRQNCKVPGKDNTQMINGKRICWNYRKGRCRFGHNCKYAHDTDIQKSNDEIEADKQVLRGDISTVCTACQCNDNLI